MLRFAIITLLVAIGSSLHLREEALHWTLQSSQLSTSLQNALSQLKQLNQSIDSSLSSINPYSQLDRISSLEALIASTRKQLIQISGSCTVPLNSQQYYCQAVPASLSSSIKNSLDSLSSHASHLGQTAAINSGSSSLNGFPASIGDLTQNITASLSSPGTVVSSAPLEVNQPNLLSNKWAIGNQTISALASQNQPAYGQNANTCPIEAPFVDQNNKCISCPAYYNMQTKSCFDCKAYDQAKHVCNDTSSTNINPLPSNPTNQTNSNNSNTNTNASLNPNANLNGNLNTNPNTNTSNTNNNSNGSFSTNSNTNPSTNSTTNPNGNPNVSPNTNTNANTNTNLSPNSNTNTNLSPNSNTNTNVNPNGSASTTGGNNKVNPNVNGGNTNNNPATPAANLRVSNSNNLAGLLLPPQMSLQQYKQSLLQNPPNQNLLPCPTDTPFFDGTACISCPNSQYFSSQARVCQTCPSQQTYNAQTYHCEAIVYYSNPEVKLWTSISTPPSQITKKMTAAAGQPNAKACPSSSPFFSGQQCISCAQPTPIFSYDGLKCTSCLPPTVFDANIFSCASPQRMQTNPATAPNLILEGRSLNEWKTYYFNNQTADAQVSDCPTSKPFFDGVTCIGCSPETPYFNLQYHLCQACPLETAYDASVKECLSTSGNIVTQSPNVLKMAAGIFA